MGTLEGKSAIVTGSGRGIGHAEALLLAAEGAGVVVNGLDATRVGLVVEEIRAAGGTAVPSTDDISTWSGAAILVERATAEFGQLDILVNNAGIIRDAMSFSMTEQQWDDVIRVNLKGHFACSHFAAVHWRERAKQQLAETGSHEVSGRIVNTTSEAGLFGSTGQLNYVASKAGIAGMSVALSRELSKYGVTVNVVAPRAWTRMSEGVLHGLENTPGELDGWAPANIAPIVAWLASDQAAGVSGEVFVVFANRVQRMSGWSPAETIETVGRWTIEELATRASELLVGRPTGTPDSAP